MQKCIYNVTPFQCAAKSETRFHFIIYFFLSLFVNSDLKDFKKLKALLFMKPQSPTNINPVSLTSSARSLSFSYRVLLNRTFHASGSNKIFIPPHFVKTVCVFILLYIFLRIFFGVMANFSSLLRSLSNGASVVFTHEWSFFNHFWLWFWMFYLSLPPFTFSVGGVEKISPGLHKVANSALTRLYP